MQTRILQATCFTIAVFSATIVFAQCQGGGQRGGQPGGQMPRGPMTQPGSQASPQMMMALAMQQRMALEQFAAAQRQEQEEQQQRDEARQQTWQRRRELYAARKRARRQRFLDSLAEKQQLTAQTVSTGTPLIASTSEATR